MEFRLLGPLEVIGDDGLPVALGGPRPRALLARLLLERNRAVSTDRLIDGIWGESPPASAQNALQVHVHALRGAFGADRIVTKAPGYLVRVESAELDAERFAHLAQGGPEELREALALWRGPALADVAYAPFAGAEAARLDEARLATLERRIDLDLEEGRHAALVGEIEALVAAHPHRERLRGQLILALYRSGRQADALDAYRDARAALDELGLEPSPDLRALERRILEHDPTLAPPSVPEPTAGPVPEPVLVGRARELAAVTALVGRDDTRLVTLTGPGGTGKTTLALAAAATLGGAPFVDLAPVTDPERVLPTIAATLGVEERENERPVEAIAQRLGTEPRLLVLDNLEHLQESFASIAALLDAVPRLRVLATSRGPLHVALEREYRVPPLEVPDAAEADLGTIAASAAVRLYVDRARESVPEFELTPENAPSVVRITRALDGLPLAIELAAARVRVLGVEGTASRLGEALAFLTRSAPDLPERQRSLRAAIDWSVRLLGPPAPHVLAVLAAFPAGATLATRSKPAWIRPRTSRPASTRSWTPGSSPRRSPAAPSRASPCCQTIRAYALAEIEPPERVEELRRRQLAGCIALAEDDRPRWWERGTPWLDRTEPELANIAAALDFARESDDAASELRLTASMRHFWRVRGHGVEARQQLEAALTRVDRVEPSLRARILYETAVMRMWVGDYDTARTMWFAAMEIYESLGDDVNVGRAHAELASLSNASGDPRGRESSTARWPHACSSREEFLHLIVLGNLAESYEQAGDLGRKTRRPPFRSSRRSARTATATAWPT